MQNLTNSIRPGLSVVLIAFTSLLTSCGSTADTTTSDGIVDVVSHFPPEKLDDIVASISKEELDQLLSGTSSEEWAATIDAANDQIAINGKRSTDNSVTFVLFPMTDGRSILGVKQVNAQVVTTQLWKFNPKANPDHQEPWEQVQLRDFLLKDFYDERVHLPDDYVSASAKPYLDIEMKKAGLAINLNKWNLMRDIESANLAPSGPLNTTLVKYTYELKWGGKDFTEEKLLIPGYSDTLLITAEIVTPDPDGPGINEFDCPHGVSINTSSTLKGQGANTYMARNMLDSAKGTAWAEGAEGSGIGEWIEFTMTENYVIGESYQMINGYAKTKGLWSSNNRIKRMRVYVDGQYTVDVMLANSDNYQWFDIAPSWFEGLPEVKKGSRVRFVITEVYKGSKFDDTVISYFVPTGNCG